MPIQNIQADFTGEAGVTPRIVRIATSDTFAAITATGYLNAAVQAGQTFYPTDIAMVSGTDLVDGAAGSAQFSIQISGGNTSLISVAKAAQSGNIGGAGAGPLSITLAGVTAASVIVANVISSSNPCAVLTCIPGTGAFTVTVDADPGASLIISYIAFIAAQ